MNKPGVLKTDLHKLQVGGSIPVIADTKVFKIVIIIEINLFTIHLR